MSRTSGYTRGAGGFLPVEELPDSFAVFCTISRTGAWVIHGFGVQCHSGSFIHNVLQGIPIQGLLLGAGLRTLCCLSKSERSWISFPTYVVCMDAKIAFLYMRLNGRNIDKGGLDETSYHSISHHIRSSPCKSYWWQSADLPYPVFRPRSRARTIRTTNHF